MKGLTKRQKDIFLFICEFVEYNEYPPTIRDVGKNFDMTVKGAYDHMKALKRKEYIKWQPKINRSIVILKEVKR